MQPMIRYYVKKKLPGDRLSGAVGGPYLTEDIAKEHAKTLAAEYGDDLSVVEMDIHKLTVHPEPIEDERPRGRLYMNRHERRRERRKIRRTKR